MDVGTASMEVIRGMDEALRGPRSRPGSGRSTPADLFTVPPALGSDADVRAALDLWAGRCLDLSLPGLAVDLLETASAGRRLDDGAGAQAATDFYL